MNSARKKRARMLNHEALVPPRLRQPGQDAGRMLHSPNFDSGKKESQHISLGCIKGNGRVIHQLVMQLPARSCEGYTAFLAGGTPY